MSDWFDHQEDGVWIGVLLAGALAAYTLVGLAWWFSPRDPEPRTEGSPSSQEPVDEPAGVRTRPSEGPSRLDRCRSVHEAQRAPLLAAKASLGQWEVHVGAMNKLVVGAITLEQAYQFWNQTRLGARARLEEFATARVDYEGQPVRCPAPGGGAGTKPVLSTCHGAVAAREETLDLATVALGTWEQHVHHMEMLRSGEMTAEQATALWLQSWRQGDREIRAYRAAARAAAGPAC